MRTEMNDAPKDAEDQDSTQAVRSIGSQLLRQRYSSHPQDMIVNQPNIVCVDPKADALWRKLIDRQHSSLFHSPDWLGVLADTYAIDTRAHVLVDQNGEPYAGLPFVPIADICGERLVVLPFSDYCDPLASTSTEWRALIDPLVANRPISMRCLRSRLASADDRFTSDKQAYWHGLDLRPDLARLWHGLDEACRRAVRKAQREGVVVRVAEHEQDLQAFFDLHLGVRKLKYGLLAQPYRFFEHIWRRFIEPQHGFLLLASYQGQVIGATMFLTWQDTLYYKFNASHPAYLAQRPNNLMIWEAIQIARQQGLAALDFGLSDWDQAGLARFKRQFGAQERVIEFLQFAPETAPSPHEQQMRSLLQELTDLLTDPSVPDPISRRAGDMLYKFFT